MYSKLNKFISLDHVLDNNYTIRMILFHRLSVNLTRSSISSRDIVDEWHDISNFRINFWQDCLVFAIASFAIGNNSDLSVVIRLHKWTTTIALRNQKTIIFFCQLIFFDLTHFARISIVWRWSQSTNLLTTNLLFRFAWIRFGACLSRISLQFSLIQ